MTSQARRWSPTWCPAAATPRRGAGGGRWFSAISSRCWRPANGCQPSFGGRSKPEAAQTPCRVVPMRQGRIRSNRSSDCECRLLLHERRCRNLTKPRPNLDFRRQRPVDGTAVSDLEQPLALRGVERTFQHDLPIYLIDLALLGLAVGAVLGVDLVVLQPDPDLLQWPVLLAGIHAQGHGRAGAEAGGQRVVGAGPGIGAAAGGRVVGPQHMRSNAHGLGEWPDIAVFDDHHARWGKFRLGHVLLLPCFPKRLA